jgi:hypothetical protein
MTQSQLFKGEHCPLCGAEIEFNEGEKWEKMIMCSECERWGRMSGYKRTPVLEW